MRTRWSTATAALAFGAAVVILSILALLLKGFLVLLKPEIWYRLLAGDGGPAAPPVGGGWDDGWVCLDPIDNPTVGLLVTSVVATVVTLFRGRSC